MNFKTLMPTIVFSLVAFCSYCLPVMQQSCAGQDKGSTNNQQIILAEKAQSKAFPLNGTAEEKLAYFDELNLELFESTLSTKVAKRSLDVDMSLSKKLKWLKKYTTNYKAKVDDILLLGGKSVYFKWLGENLNSYDIKNLEESIDGMQLKLSKATEEEFLMDRENLALVATAKFACISSLQRFKDIRENKIVTKSDAVLKAITEAEREIDKILACSESICQQAIHYQKDLLKIVESELQNYDIVLSFERNKFYFESRNERDRKLAELQVQAKAQAKTEAKQQR